MRRVGPVTREVSLWEQQPTWVRQAVCIGFLFVVAVGLLGLLAAWTLFGYVFDPVATFVLLTLWR